MHTGVAGILEVAALMHASITVIYPGWMVRGIRRGECLKDIICSVQDFPPLMEAQREQGYHLTVIGESPELERDAVKTKVLCAGYEP